MLAALPHKQYQRLLTGLESIALTFGEVLYEPGERIRHVYFPNDSLVSLLTVVEGHLALEVGMVGREGMVGVPLSLGTDVSPVRALVQGAGAAMRMKSARFSDEFRLTHEFLGNMLGVRRVGVTTAARALQKRKLIAYSRGKIRILDRRGLEGAACSCYELVRDMNGAVQD